MLSVIRGRRAHTHRTLHRREERLFYALISPWLVGFLAFTAGPMIISLFLSLTSYDLFSPPVFVGLHNYWVMLTQDPLFWVSMKNSLFMVAVDLPVGMIASLLAALLLNRRAAGVQVFRSIFFIPVLVPAVANALLWLWILDPQFGVLNYLFGLAHLPAQNWLGSEILVKPSMILIHLMRMGGGMIIFLAGLQSIPEQFYEAASIEGAGAWARFRHITLPLLSPSIFFQLVLGLIGELQIFTESYVMTRGGPNYSSLFYQVYLYQNAFRYYRMGYASAMAWFLFAITFAITLLVFRSSPWWVHYGAERRR